MDSFKDSLAFWASILGTLVGLVGVLQSVTWLVALGVLAIVVSVGATAYARREPLPFFHLATDFLGFFP